MQERKHHQETPYLISCTSFHTSTAAKTLTYDILEALSFTRAARPRAAKKFRPHTAMPASRIAAQQQIYIQTKPIPMHVMQCSAPNCSGCSLVCCSSRKGVRNSDHQTLLMCGASRSSRSRGMVFRCPTPA